MKIKTSELTGQALDWAVAMALGTLGQKPSRCFDCKHYEERQGRDEAIQYCHHPKMDFVDGSEAFGTWPSDYATHEKCPISEMTAEPYSTNWSQAGPIIERECIGVLAYGHCSVAPKNPEYWEAAMDATNESITHYGSTPLIAAMRCYVASKVGDEIDVPEELK